MKKLVGLLMVTLLVSCAKKSDTTPVFVEHEGTVTRISVTNSLNVGQQTTVTVDFSGGQSCDEADHVERTQTGKAVTIKAFYKHPNNNPPCLDSQAQLELNFQFTPDQTGQFIFRSAQDANIADTLNVF